MLNTIDPQSKEVSVSMGSLTVSSNTHEILTTFLGSCVGLCLYETKAKIAGLAHVMLPNGRGKPVSSVFDAKYADHAIEAILRIMKEKGANERDVVAKIVGGSKIFSNDGEREEFGLDIGERNAESIRTLLREQNIPLLSEDIGSNQGRWIWFHVSSGLVIVAKRTYRLTL
jgi:chemotaxis protein CheD